MDDTLRRQVERLIIENRNSLNDPTTNEPYDVKGIADDVIELFQAREQQLLTELLGKLPKKEELVLQQTKLTDYQVGYNAAHQAIVSVIERKIGELNG